MGPFRKRSTSEGFDPNAPDVVIQRSSPINYKMHTQDVNEPVLTAVREAQPFEVMNLKSEAQVSPEYQFRDSFGQAITDPDRSNPTRPRNERPLDTIRSFEYACTGDRRIQEEMETPRLGWALRKPLEPPNFDVNPYAANSDFANAAPINFTPAPAMRAPEPEKKKRGLFGRKKK